MSENNKQDVLQHWGIKGMRWGVRRSQKELDRMAGRAKKDLDEDDFKTTKKKKLSKLSDDEIRKEIDRRKLEQEYQKTKDDEFAASVKRLELEKKYEELNPPKLSLGQRIMQDVWPRAKKATLDAGETLLRDGLIKKGKEALGITDNETDWNKELTKLNVLEKKRKLANPEVNYDNLLKKIQYDEALKKRENENK